MIIVVRMLASPTSRCLCNVWCFHRKHLITVTKPYFKETFRGQLKSCRAQLYTKPVIPKRRLSKLKRWHFFGSGLSGEVAALKFQFVQYRLQCSRTGIPPKITPSRSVKFSADKTGLKLTLYQYQSCPFCGKVRAFLNFNGISYDVVEVGPLTKTAIKFSKWRKVPIVILENANGGQQLNDSSMIISCLQSYLMDKTRSISKLASYYPTKIYKNEKGDTVTEIPNRYNLMYGTRALDMTKEDFKLEKKWRVWADTVLVPIVTSNIFRTPSEAEETLRWFSEVAEWEKMLSAWELYIVLYIGPFKMYLIGKDLKTWHGLKEDVRQSLYIAGREWTTAIDQKRFMGGGKPNLADLLAEESLQKHAELLVLHFSTSSSSKVTAVTDFLPTRKTKLAVFGVLNTIEGCAAYQDLIKYIKISDWYRRTKLEVDSHLM